VAAHEVRIYLLVKELPMTMRRRLGDRRSRPRFEIVGQLWGSLETQEPLDLVNLSRGGALLEGRVPLAADSVQRLRVRFEDQTLDVQARVRHVATLSRATDGERYLIGLEFLGLQEQVLEHIDRLLAINAAETSSSAGA
jgi:hypothetical protein